MQLQDYIFSQCNVIWWGPFTIQTKNTWLLVSTSNVKYLKNKTMFSYFKYSHKKRKDSLETRAVLIEISMLCWNLPSGPKHRRSLQKKTWLSLKGISYLQVIFVLIWMKQALIWLNLQGDGTGNGLPNIKDTFAESLQLQMSVLHQSMCIIKTGLSSLYYGWAKYKEKVPDVSDHNQNVEITYNSKLKFTELKDLLVKRVEKSQRWIICI